MNDSYVLGEFERWSTWPQVSDAGRGPQPWPEWVVQDDNARDCELGLVRGGKEADVFLIRRVSATSGRSCLLAAKRYRPGNVTSVRNVVFNGRDRAFQHGRDQRAVSRKSKYGQFLMKTEWADSEFRFLCELWKAGVAVPYPVQINGQEILSEWIHGEDPMVAAPRLVNAQLSRVEVADCFEIVRESVLSMAQLGYAHGDLSAYNILYSRSRGPVIIDCPQVVDIVLNPLGMEVLRRDCINVSRAFEAKGFNVDQEVFFADCVASVFS